MKYWQTILRWQGWTAWIKWSGWKRIGAWAGWKNLLFPHPAIVIVLTILSALGLVGVFTLGLENSMFGYLLYPVSFYALVTLIAMLVRLVPKIKKRASEDILVKKILEDEELTFRIGLYKEQLINMGYGVFKLVSAAIHASVWIGADGLYNFVQGVIQLYQIIRRKKKSTLEEQWRCYRQCGYLMIVLHLTMTGLVFQTIHMGEHSEYPGYMIFATAAFTFYKLINSFLDLAKDRKHHHPVDSAVRLLNWSQALYNLFVLQAAMLWEFGGRNYPQRELMNSLTGGAVCVMVLATGIYMLRRSSRVLREMEDEHGRI